MFHLPPKEFLYSAYKILVTFSDHSAKPIERSATGFIIGLKGGKVPFIVTNRHVIDLNYNQTSAKYKDYKIATFEIFGRNNMDKLYKIRIHPKAKVYYHPDPLNDVVLIESYIYMEGNTFHYLFLLDHIADSEVYKTIYPYDHICYSGFPPQHDQFSQRPLLRAGVIASDPKFEYTWKSDRQGQCVAYEGFSFGGSSGSPIYAVPRQGNGTIETRSQGYVIGVNAGHVHEQYQHSGISYFYKSILIHEIISLHNLS